MMAATAAAAMAAAVIMTGSAVARVVRKMMQKVDQVWQVDRQHGGVLEGA
jgi:hypothetical protein